jgi:hypothetical protein
MHDWQKKKKVALAPKITFLLETFSDLPCLHSGNCDYHLLLCFPSQHLITIWNAEVSLLLFYCSSFAIKRCFRKG